MGCVYALKLNIFLYTQHTVLAFTYSNSKSNQRRCSLRKSFLRNFLKVTAKELLQSLFFNKVEG